MEDFSGLWVNTEHQETVTSIEQRRCEESCADFLAPFTSYSRDHLEKFKVGGLVNEDNEIRILRTMHSIFLVDGLGRLPSGYISLDASRPWICYWILHALYLLEKEPTYIYPRVVATLGKIMSPTGGFGGGPGQLAHGAPNYAAVLALCTVGSDAALGLIDRNAMYRYFLTMKHPCGGFRMHLDGEVDSRSTYTVVSVARVLNILTPELVEGTAEFLLSCQTYEGGFGGEPFNEAHGGYNFCAMAALLILGRAQDCDLVAQEHWLLQRQMKLEGGFQGRTNKLVDSCYSFWQGAGHAMINIVKCGGDDLYDMRQYFARQKSMTSSAGGEAGEDDIIELEESMPVHIVDDYSGPLAFNQKALQRYILHCGQQMEGGMRDKPGKSRDHYHSCYALSGLSVAQSFSVTSHAPEIRAESTEAETRPQVYGDSANLLQPTSVVYNIGLTKLKNAVEYYLRLPVPIHAAFVTK